MPSKSVDVPTEVFFVAQIDNLYIPIYHTYKNGDLEDRYDFWFSFYADVDITSDGSFDVRVFDDNGKLERISRYNKEVEWNETAKEIILEAIKKGELEEFIPEDIQHLLELALRGSYEPVINPGCCPHCGNNKFYARQQCYHTVIVDKDNNFEDNIEVGDSNNPYGPYQCTLCGSEFSNLPNGRGISG